MLSSTALPITKLSGRSSAAALSAFAPFDSTPGVFDNDVFEQTLKGNCRIPLDYFLAQNEPYKSFVKLYASDPHAFVKSYSQAFAFMGSFNPATQFDGGLFHPLDLTPPTGTSKTSSSHQASAATVANTHGLIHGERVDEYLFKPASCLDKETVNPIPSSARAHARFGRDEEKYAGRGWRRGIPRQPIRTRWSRTWISRGIRVNHDSVTADDGLNDHLRPDPLLLTASKEMSSRPIHAAEQIQYADRGRAADIHQAILTLVELDTDREEYGVAVPPPRHSIQNGLQASTFEIEGAACKNGVTAGRRHSCRCAHATGGGAISLCQMGGSTRSVAGFLAPSPHPLAAMNPVERKKGWIRIFFYQDSGDINSTSINLADAINLAAIATIRACGGPAIQYSSGMDIFGPDPDGLLPLASDPANVTIANLNRMGFSPEQIVALVMGSHTLGGEHRVNFPDLTRDEFAPFDSTPAVFDNDFFASDQEAFFKSYSQAFGSMTVFNPASHWDGGFEHILDLNPPTRTFKTSPSQQTSAAATAPTLVKREERGCPFPA
ncbi:hypothetical protein BDK51DRAFT_38037 [Blyttiomyces helicus]|uniref:Peroxidase n=1 Tax=Blyttiomyces helicus TaxID=388810 RepID=A0A4P9W9X5_9FUNG|nr:hypothetical protein BDK51DRAFT_38037 [Blyttiomyces helicus]|eukprot:RKO88293.1 hypothetical protein BDK51DRAFT_38037 [Blyttiomyces helicus]